jgi:hypothetical protein
MSFTNLKIILTKEMIIMDKKNNFKTYWIKKQILKFWNKIRTKHNKLKLKITKMINKKITQIIAKKTSLSISFINKIILKKINN